MKNIVILISGRGSNMEALIAARDAGNLPVNIAAVISNRPDAKGLETAAKAGIVTHYIDHKGFAGREAFDAALAECIDMFSPDLVVLAGFMRILTEGFVRHYEGRLLNIHPSLLPSFPGLHTHQRALEEGVRIHGCTVHFVTAELDHGPVVIQAAIPVLDGDTEESLAARILRQEHKVYPQAVRWFAEDKLSLVDGKVRLAADLRDDTVLIAPELR
ncbi:phosphoribosylglycinamide formyltransferase [Azonexus sp. IMCC34839]|uniref:phosphoribosylglycinamide formyltransferase n=1 Tax=Azonexus sp. IMCC34839 TaxID=3133695 RepID=UPI00399A4559